MTLFLILRPLFFELGMSFMKIHHSLDILCFILLTQKLFSKWKECSREHESKCKVRVEVTDDLELNMM